MHVTAQAGRMAPVHATRRDSPQPPVNGRQSWAGAASPTTMLIWPASGRTTVACGRRRQRLAEAAVTIRSLSVSPDSAAAQSLRPHRHARRAPRAAAGRFSAYHCQQAFLCHRPGQRDAVVQPVLDRHEQFAAGCRPARSPKRSIFAATRSGSRPHEEPLQQTRPGHSRASRSERRVAGNRQPAAVRRQRRRREDPWGGQQRQPGEIRAARRASARATSPPMQ